MAILKGKSIDVNGGNGRVLESTEDDHVFIYFSDHGAPGLVAFPYP
jgi:legumain